jgi:hypothetical protein
MYLKDILFSDDRKFTEAFYNYVDRNDYSKELKLTYLKKVLMELSIKIGFDLEPVKEVILSRHSNLSGISYPIFKECICEWLENQEKILSTTIFVDDNNMGVLNLPKEDEKSPSLSKSPQFERYNFDPDYDINMIILQRSLYILKRKFEIYEKEIMNIYGKYMEKNKMEFIIDSKKFQLVLNEVLLETKLSFSDINKPSEVFKVELLEHLNKDKLKIILLKIDQFMQDYRKKYNKIMKEKKEKNFLKSNNNENQAEDRGSDDLNFQEGEVEGDINLINNNELEANNLKSSIKENSMQEKLEEEAQDGQEVQENDEIPKDNEEEKLNAVGENPQEENPQDETIQQMNKNLQKLENLGDIKKDEDPFREGSNQNINLRKWKKTLDDDLKSLIMDRSNLNLLQSKYQPNTNEESEDPRLKNIINQLKNNKPGVQKQSDTTYRIQYLLIEILPLIIADYVHDNFNVVIIDTNEELKSELRTLFDNELLQRLGENTKYDIDEEKTIKLKDLLFEKLNLEKNIRTYEDLLLKKQSKRENTIFIEQMLKKLRNQKFFIENKIKTLQEDNETLNSYKNISLFETSENRENQGKKSSGKNLININNSNNFSRLLNDESTIIKKNVSKIVPKNLLSKDELRSNALREIFYFYSRQHQLAGHTATFDEIASKAHHMDLGEFMKFCIEFKILVKKEKLIEVFRKSASNTKQMTYEEFLIGLRNISAKVNEEKRQLLIKRLNRMKAELKKLGIDGLEPKEVNKEENQQENLNQEKSFENEENKQDEMQNQTDRLQEQENREEEKIKTNENEEERNLSNNVSKISQNQQDKNQESKPKDKISKKASLVYSDSKELIEEISKFKMMINDLKNKTYQTLLEELYIYLEIDNEKLYRAKMKGYVLPFNTHEKSYRIPNDVLMKNAKKVDPRTAEEIKRILKTRKEEKIREEQERERLEKLKYFEQKKKISQANKNILNSQQTVTNNTEAKKEENYVKIKRKYETYTKEKESKLTWDQLESLSYNHFVSNKDDDFNPNDLIDENDFDSDDDELLQNLKTGNSHRNPNQSTIKLSQNSPSKNQQYSQEKVYNYANAALMNKHNNLSNKNVNKSIMSTSAERADRSMDNSMSSGGNKINKSKSRSPGPVNKEGYHDHKYFISKTEQKAKELERQWEQKQAKVIKKFRIK